MGVAKISGMIMEFFLNKIFKDKILITPFMSTQGVAEAVLTFGASDFLDFLISHYVEVGKVNESKRDGDFGKENKVLKRNKMYYDKWYSSYKY